MGTGANVVNIDVQCFAIVTPATVQQIAAGISATDLNVIMSISQIDKAQWPGGTVPLISPFDVDQRVPRVNADKLIAQGRMRSVTFVDAKFGGDGGKEILRFDMRVTG